MKHDPQRLFLLALLLALLPGGAGCRVAGSRPPSPQRPTLSSDTSTTAQGTLEVETGVDLDPDDRFGLPTTLKYGLSDTGEVSLGLSLFERIDRPGDDADGPSDVTVATRHRVWERGPDSAAFQLATKLPTADEDEGLSSGELDFGAAGILSHSGSPLSWTAFGELSWLGDPSGGTDPRQALALAASVPGPGASSLFGELAHIGGSGPDQQFATLGTAWPAGDAVLDLGVRLGIDDDAPDLVLLVGMTLNLARPWAPTAPR